MPYLRTRNATLSAHSTFVKDTINFYSHSHLFRSLCTQTYKNPSIAREEEEEKSEERRAKRKSRLPNSCIPPKRVTPIPAPPPSSAMHHHPSDPDRPSLHPIQPSSPRFAPHSASTPTAGAHRKIAIAVDLSDESAYAVRWAVQNYLRPGDAVILLHVRPTSVLYGADWGSIDLSVCDTDEESQQKLEEDFDAFTAVKAADLSQPLVDAQIPFKIHIVKDHDMKERLCLEVERLGLSAVIMGSRGFGASRRGSKGRLGSVSDYCVHHCVCPVVVVRYPEDKDGVGEAVPAVAGSAAKVNLVKEAELHPVPEEEQEHDDAAEEQKDG